VATFKIGYSAHANFLIASIHLDPLRNVWRRGKQEVGRRKVERPAPYERAKRSLQGIDAAQTRLNDVMPLIESDLTIAQAAEKLGISVEAMSALIVSCLGGSRLPRR
jgi:hypothetical protein